MCIIDIISFWDVMAVNQDALSELLSLAAQEKCQQDTILYLAQHLGRFVEPGERVLICFTVHEKGNLSWLMEQAVLRCGGRPVIWGEDHRWKSLLRLAFTSRASTIIGTPLLILGLGKLKNANNTPLFIQNVVVAGYPCDQWMIDGINNSFDCHSWSCFGLGISGVVAGFSCDNGRYIHLREDAYTLQILDEDGQPAVPGQVGTWVLSPREHPEIRYCPQEYAKIEPDSCPCGDPAPRIRTIHYARVEDPELADLGKYLFSWTSVLDLSLNRGPYGLELELVIFPGEKLPKLPTCARQVVRPWRPDRDEPFLFLPWRKKEENFADSH